MEEIKKKKFYQKKWFLFTVLPMFICFVIAGGYLVSTLVLTVGVAEPFTIQYAVLGDAGTYTTGTCEDEGLNWFTSNSQSIPTGNFYPMEARLVCVKITNAGEVSIPYTITSTVTNDVDNLCANAFDLPDTLTGSAGNGVNYNEKLVQISADATPVSGCKVTISVLRG